MSAVDCLWRLSSDNKSGNNSAAISLITILNNAKPSEEFTYSLGRLVKGTASDRNDTKESFFCTLSILLKVHPEITFNDVYDILHKDLRIGSLSKSETGDVCTGHILVCGAIIRSDLFLRCTDEERSKLIATLFTASSKKKYLSFAVYYILVDFINNHLEEEILTTLWPYLKEHILHSIENQSIDSLYCLLTISERCPKITNKILKKLGITSFFSKEIVTKFSEIIMNVPEFSYVNHPIYELIGKELVKSENLISFWIDGIESKMNFQNENRVLVALTVLGAIFKNIHVNVHQLPLLLSNKFLPCILDWFRGFQSTNSTKKIHFKIKNRNSSYESKSKQIMIKAKEVFDILIDLLKTDSVPPNIKLEVLKKLIFFPGDIMFSDITNTTIIKNLIEILDINSIYSLADDLKRIITNDSKKPQINEIERHWTTFEKLRAAELFSNLINHKVAINDVKWRIKNMEFLIQIGLFKSTGFNDSYISSELSASIMKCFFRCLTLRLSKLEMLLKILEALVKYIDKNINNKETLKNNSKLDTSLLNTWNSMKTFILILDQSNMKNSKAYSVFKILTLHCGLFVFSDTIDLEMTKNSLSEVKNCYEHFLVDDKVKENKIQRVNEGVIVEDEPEWTEVLVDIFLSFLSRESHLLRNVVQCVFRLLCDYITPSAINQILSVLDTDDDTNILSYQEDSDDDIRNENDISGKDENSESDESNEDEDNEDGNDEHDDDSDEMDEQTTVNDQLRIAVQKALGSAAPETDTESIDVDDIGEEEGLKIDEALSNAFKLLKQSKGKISKKEKKDIKTLMGFRIRVLDLLLIYLEKSPSMEICLAMLSPLFKCLEFAVKDSFQKPLEDKVRKCIKFLTSIKFFSSTDGITLDVLADYLKLIMTRGDRTQFVFQALGDVISKSGVFIIRCSQKLSHLETSCKKKNKNISGLRIVDIYKDALEAFFVKRDSLLPVILFHDILQLKWDGNWELLDLIVDKVFDRNIRQFRRQEGLEMINVFYRNLKRLTNIDSENIESNLFKFEDKFSKTINDSFNNTGGILIPERFFCILIKTLLMVHNYNSSKNFQSSMDWKNIQQVIQNYRSNIKLKNTQEYFKFCNIFKIEKIKNNKSENKTIIKESIDSGLESNVEENSLSDNRLKVNGNVPEEIMSIEKTKKSKKKNFTKKESKQLRLIASSEGLQNISFTKLLDESNININDISEKLTEDMNNEKKRKISNENVSKKSKKIKILQ